MPLYDKDIPKNPIVGDEALPTTNTTNISFTDGSFYPFLKFFINMTTKIPNEYIYYKGYGQNDPFLEQSGVPRAYIEQYEFGTPAMSGDMDGYGDLTILQAITYRVYFANDMKRAPLLFEHAIRTYPDKLNEINKVIMKEFAKEAVSLPRIFSIKDRKHYQGMSIMPIVGYDVFCVGHVTINVKELENTPFDDINGGIKLNERS